MMIKCIIITPTLPQHNLDLYVNELFENEEAVENLDAIFSFLMHIQDYEEDVVERFFDNCSVEYLHASLFLLPVTEKSPSDLKRVMRDHVKFLEARGCGEVRRDIIILIS
jgi:hypothetical protein